MKTSNKILLGVFVLVLLVLTGIHFALYQKFKNGQFETAKSMDNKESDIKLKPVKHVRLEGLDNVIFEQADNYRLQVENGMPKTFKYRISGDTLIVYNDAVEAAKMKNDFRRVYQEIKILAPQFALIEAHNSSVSIRGRGDSSGVRATRIELVSSRITFGNQLPEGSMGSYYGDISIVARQRSEIEFSANTVHFNTLSCELEKSAFRDNEMGEINRLILKADDSSRVEVGGANLKKLVVGTKE